MSWKNPDDALAPWVNGLLGSLVKEAVWQMTPTRPVRSEEWSPAWGPALGEATVGIEGYAGDLRIEVTPRWEHPSKRRKQPFWGSSGQVRAHTDLSYLGLRTPDDGYGWCGGVHDPMSAEQVARLEGLVLRFHRGDLPPGCEFVGATIPLDWRSLVGDAPEPVIPPSAWPHFEPWERAYYGKAADGGPLEGFDERFAEPVIRPEDASALTDDDWRRLLHPSLHWMARRGLPGRRRWILPSDLYKTDEWHYHGHSGGPLRCLVCGTRICDSWREEDSRTDHPTLTGSRLDTGAESTPEWRERANTVPSMAWSRGRRAHKALCPGCGSVLGLLWSRVDDGTRASLQDETPLFDLGEVVEINCAVGAVPGEGPGSGRPDGAGN